MLCLPPGQFQQTVIRGDKNIGAAALSAGKMNSIKTCEAKMFKLMGALQLFLSNRNRLCDVLGNPS